MVEGGGEGVPNLKSNDTWYLGQNNQVDSMDFFLYSYFLTVKIKSSPPPFKFHSKGATKKSKINSDQDLFIMAKLIS